MTAHHQPRHLPLTLVAAALAVVSLLAAYKAGNKQQAYTMARSVTASLYEGTTEGTVASVYPAGSRQLDPLLMATIPAAIQNGESTSQVAALIHRGQTLASSCLDAIHKNESSGG